MFEIIDNKASRRVLELLRKNYGINYFIRLGLEQKNPVFRTIWLQSKPKPDAVLLQRRSGNLHIFATDSANLSELVELIKTLEFRKIMGDLALIQKLHFNLPNLELTRNSYIASYELNSHEKFILPNVENLKYEHLPEVMELYQTIFEGFPKLEYLYKKLESKRGRGYILRNELNEISSIVQTDFEEDNHATITGVGTTANFQRKGQAYKLMQHVHHDLYNSGFKKLYLQYDDEKAGSLYAKLGYKVETRMGNIINES